MRCSSTCVRTRSRRRCSVAESRCAEVSSRTRIRGSRRSARATLRRGRNVLIIDAKYYSHTTQERFDRRSVHSGNLYQIFTYVKNAAASLGENDHEVSGLLLYARTDEEIQPHATYQMSGNSISVQTLDLNLPFAQIAAQLDDIAERHCPRPGRSTRA